MEKVRNWFNNPSCGWIFVTRVWAVDLLFSSIAAFGFLGFYVLLFLAVSPVSSGSSLFFWLGNLGALCLAATVGFSFISLFLSLTMKHGGSRIVTQDPRTGEDRRIGFSSSILVWLERAWRIFVFVAVTILPVGIPLYIFMVLFVAAVLAFHEVRFASKTALSLMPLYIFLILGFLSSIGSWFGLRGALLKFNTTYRTKILISTED